MAKKNGEKVTIDQLAMIINKGFDGQMEFMKKEFEVIDGKLTKLATKVDKVDERLERVETVLTDAHVL